LRFGRSAPPTPSASRHALAGAVRELLLVFAAKDVLLAGVEIRLPQRSHG
jgi:hypothetical protein